MLPLSAILPLLKYVAVLSLIFVSFGGEARGDAKIIELKGGNPGQGFAPLAEDAGSIKVGGDEFTVQGITFSRDPGPTGPTTGGTYKTEAMTAAGLGFGNNPTVDDTNLAALLQEFRYVGRGTFDFSDSSSYAQYNFKGLKPNQDYQLDLFTVADANPRPTNFQVIGAGTFQDTVVTQTQPQIVQYTLKPDASGTITVRFGFGGGTQENAGLLSAIAITTDEVLQPASVSIDKASQSAVVVTGKNAVRLQPWSEGALRISAAPGSSIPDKKSLAVISAPNPAGWQVTEDDQSVRLQSKKLSASVDKKSGLISIYGADGKLLLQQKAWSFKPAGNPKRDGLRAKVTFIHSPNERFFGGGVIGDDFRKPSTEIKLQNDYLQMHIPILYSTRGYGFFWDSPDRSILKTSPEEISWESSTGDLADFYVMAGPEADAVVGEYRTLTGAAPLLPKWAYGFWFSKNKFDHQEQILEAAKNFRERQIPIDMLVQDYFYWKPTGSTDNWIDWGSHKFVPDRYPDPRQMIEELHDKDHIHFMAVIWAKFDVEDTDNGKELLAAGGLFPIHDDGFGKPLRYYDPFNPEARKIYGRQVMDDLLSLGLDAFWMDGAEPEMNMDKFASFDTAIGPASRVMSAFPLMHTTAVYDAQRAVTQDKRVVLLPRSAWAGSQRNSAISWTSDINSDWKTLAWQIEGLQNYSITGLPYVTTDIDGYNPTPEADRELFLRWFQWGTFCPILRVHGVARAFPWEYGSEGESVIKKFDNLRYSLLPYTYSEASRVTLKNGTLMRPLVMDFRDDPKAVDQWDEFLFGPSILVCPVYTSTRESVATSDQIADLQGNSRGVTVSYLKAGGEVTTVHRDLKNRFELKDGPEEDKKGAQSIRLEGTFTPDDSGPLAFEVDEIHPEGFPVTATIDGNPVPSNPLNGDRQFPLFPFEAKAGVPVHFSLETKMLNPGFRVVRILGTVHRDVYLPGSVAWYDFWTGKTFPAAQTLNVETPVDMIPLYVRAGSIIPMSPGLQYADEKPDGPIEIRVYRGADGAYALYHDEDNNYDYEKGLYEIIPITWNEQKQTLTFGAREGSFPGMPAKRTFKVVWVSPNHGVGEGETPKPDVEVTYEGVECSIKALQ